MRKLLLIVIMSVVWAGSAISAEIFIPATNIKAGQIAEIPVKLDTADNLAGVKIVMKYDADILTFKQADKTKETSGLMHIVNDKKPGILIIVMAGAKGFSGKDIRLFVMSFESKKDLKETKTVKLEITESQLMSDQLKDIAHTVKTEAVSISPEK